MTAVVPRPFPRLVRMIVPEIRLPAAARGVPITLSGEDLGAIAEQVEELVGLRRRVGLVDAGSLAAELGVARDWVYDNADRLRGVRWAMDGEHGCGPMRSRPAKRRATPSASRHTGPNRRRCACGAPRSSSELARTRLAVLSDAPGRRLRATV